LLEDRVEGAVTTEVTVFDDGQAFALALTKAEDGTFELTGGKLPFGVSETTFGLVPSTQVKQASIPDESGMFDPNVKAALAALGPLQSGSIDVTSERVKITGVARTPIEELEARTALTLLPSAIKQDVNLTVLDDGTPPAYELDFKASKGLSLAGKLPAGLKPEDVSGLLGLEINSNAARTSLIGKIGEDKTVITEFGVWLPELDQGTLRVEDGTVSVTGVVSTGADLDLVRNGMRASMGGGVDVDLTTPETLPPRGTVRTNALTQQSERFMGVSWMPVLKFDTGLAACEEQTTTALSENKINFVTGSARLDAQSVRALNLLGAIVRRCVEEAGLKAEVQGHTDAQGSNAANQGLSQRRADSVVDALVIRGVPSGGLNAIGYGETQPIADNATAQGRASNRRTTIVWTE
jgi:OOP family OmpA-OmpF porin